MDIMSTHKSTNDGTLNTLHNWLSTLNFPFLQIPQSKTVHFLRHFAGQIWFTSQSEPNLSSHEPDLSLYSPCPNSYPFLLIFTQPLNPLFIKLYNILRKHEVISTDRHILHTNGIRAKISFKFLTNNPRFLYIPEAIFSHNDSSLSIHYTRH